MNKMYITLLTIIIVGIIGCSKNTKEVASTTDPIVACTENLTKTKAELVAWKDTIFTQLDAMEQQETKILESLATVQVPADKTIQTTIAKAAFSELKTKRENMRELYNVVMDLLAFDETAFAEFKAKAEAGSLSQEELDKEIKFYNNHFEFYQSDIINWRSVMKEIEIESIGNQKKLQAIIAENSK